MLYLKMSDGSTLYTKESKCSVEHAILGGKIWRIEGYMDEDCTKPCIIAVRHIVAVTESK